MHDGENVGASEKRMVGQQTRARAGGNAPPLAIALRGLSCYKSNEISHSFCS